MNNQFRNGRILVMDDEVSIRQILVQMLDLLNYECVAVSNGSEAVDTYRQMMSRDQGFDAVILDLTIPGGMGGKETVGELLSIHPDAKIFLSSGYSAEPVISNYKAYGFYGLLLKPYTIERIKELLGSLN